MRRLFSIFLLSFTLFGLPEFLNAQQQPQIHEEVTVRWWLVPVYATDKAGLPVLDLVPGNFEVFIGGKKVESFSLHVKKFDVAEKREPTDAASRQDQPPAQKKMVFLVFDAAFAPYSLMAKAKSIARSVIARSDATARYILISIEPLAGLHYICGPTQDLKLLRQSMDQYIDGKKADYLLKTSDLDSTQIRSPYPGWTPSGGVLGTHRAHFSEKIDWLDKKRMASSVTSSLMTLSHVLGLYRDFSKVIYLYSCGIPSGAFSNRAEFPEYTSIDMSKSEWYVYFSPSGVGFDSLKLIGKYLNQSGALLFLINPAGTRVQESDWDAGEQSLRILAGESGGRYFEGAEKDIAKEVNQMEAGYYEISFPDKTEYKGQEMSFEIRSNRPGVSLYSVKNVGREKDYKDMAPLEQEVLALNILNEGPFARAKQKVLFVQAKTAAGKDQDTCLLPLPPELGRSVWDIYMIWRDLEMNAIEMERDLILPDSPSLEVRTKSKKKDLRLSIIAIHRETGTALVAR